MVCPNCGKNVSDSRDFCPYCKAKIKTKEGDAPAPVLKESAASGNIEPAPPVRAARPYIPAKSPMPPSEKVYGGGGDNLESTAVIKKADSLVKIIFIILAVLLVIGFFIAVISSAGSCREGVIPWTSVIIEVFIFLAAGVVLVLSYYFIKITLGFFYDIKKMRFIEQKKADIIARTEQESKK